MLNLDDIRQRVDILKRFAMEGQAYKRRRDELLDTVWKDYEFGTDEHIRGTEMVNELYDIDTSKKVREKVVHVKPETRPYVRKHPNGFVYSLEEIEAKGKEYIEKTEYPTFHGLAEYLNVCDSTLVKMEERGIENIRVIDKLRRKIYDKREKFRNKQSIKRK